MKRNLLCAAMVLMAGSIIADDSASKDDVNNAVGKLAAADNYSWKTISAFKGGGGRFHPGPTVGKTQKDGLTLVSFTMNDNTIETVVQGDKGAIKTEDGWVSLDEAAKEDQGPARFMARRLQNFKSPAAEVQTILSKTKELTKSDDAYSGDLTPEGAKSMLTFGRRRGGGEGPAITGAKGSVTFWVKDGTIVKYEVKVQGTITRDGEDTDIDRTTTTEISEIGTTKVEPPDEAKKKLS
jgi:hypothetical protein